MATNDDDNGWIIDFVKQFLESPPWTTPISNFIDQNCHVFDDADENKLSYTEVHLRYLTLVEDLLTFNLEELGLEPQQFVDVCAAGAAGADEVFSQILVLDDFLTFKKLMVKRNRELELEALVALQTAAEEQEETADATDATDATDAVDENDADLVLALRLSQEAAILGRTQKAQAKQIDNAAFKEALAASVVQQQVLNRLYEKEQADLEHAIALSLAAEAERLRMMQAVVEKLPDLVEEITTSAEEAASKADNLHKEEMIKHQDKINAMRSAKRAAAEAKRAASPVKAAPPPVTRAPRALPALKALPKKVALQQIDQQRARLEAASKQANAQFEANRKARMDQKEAERVILEQKAKVDQEELARRLQFMVLQRQHILAKKTRQREAELKQHNSATAGITDNQRAQVVASVFSDIDINRGADVQQAVAARLDTLDQRLSEVAVMREAKVAKAQEESSALSEQERARAAEQERVRKQLAACGF
jgi:hypothetical protein